MMTPDVLHFRQAQSQRLARFGVSVSVDMHCHCLPGLDDGPATLDDAVTLCEALVRDGITAVIASPHQMGPFEHITAAAIRRAVDDLVAELARRAIPLTVRAGAEIRADERLLSRLAAGDLLTLPDGGAYVMIELPHSTLLDLRPLIETLVAGGLTPIIAHPERNAALVRSPQLLAPWLARGAVLQVTAGSLAGAFGPPAMHSAWHLVDVGWVSMIASDAHDAVARPPAMTAAIDAMAARVGHAVTRRLCVTNPQAVFEGRSIVKPRVSAKAGMKA